MTRTPVLAATAALMLAALAPAAQAEMAPGTYVYQIVHSRYGKIGTHTITLAKQGAQTVANVALRIRVKILLITAHRENADRREVWQGGRMVGYTSATTENGKKIMLSAKAAGANLMITGPAGTKTAPGGTFPTNPWHIGILKAKTVMDTKTGAVQPVTAITPQGDELVSAGGSQVKAKKYLFSAGTRRILWFDAGGRLVKFRVFNDGNTVTFTLK
jgi:hypothetical protein